MSLSRIFLALIAAAVVAFAAAPSHAAAYDVVGKPQLYAVDDPEGAGQPVAYVVFKGTSRLHKVRDARARVSEHSGRSYSWPGSCVRSSFVNDDDEGTGTPQTFLDAGQKYKVTISYRGKTVWSGRLAAHHLADDALPKRC